MPSAALSYQSLVIDGVYDLLSQPNPEYVDFNFVHSQKIENWTIPNVTFVTWSNRKPGSMKYIPITCILQFQISEYEYINYALP